jgi:hypothetical protein
MPTKNTTTSPRQAFPVGQTYVPLTAVPTLGRALVDGSENEVSYINSFLHHLAQNKEIDDKEMEDLDDSRRRKRKSKRWRDNYPKIKRTSSSKKHKKKSKSSSSATRSASFSFHPTNAAATIAELDKYLKRRGSDSGIDYSQPSPTPISHSSDEGPSENEELMQSPVTDPTFITTSTTTSQESPALACHGHSVGSPGDSVDASSFATLTPIVSPSVIPRTSYTYRPTPVAVPSPHCVQYYTWTPATPQAVIPSPAQMVNATHTTPTPTPPEPVAAPVTPGSPPVLQGLMYKHAQDFHQQRLPPQVVTHPTLAPVQSNTIELPEEVRHLLEEEALIGGHQVPPAVDLIAQPGFDAHLTEFLADHEKFHQLELQLQKIQHQLLPLPYSNEGGETHQLPLGFGTEERCDGDFLDELFAWEGLPCS